MQDFNKELGTYSFLHVFYSLFHTAITLANLLSLSNPSASGREQTEFAVIPRKILHWAAFIILFKYSMPNFYN